MTRVIGGAPDLGAHMSHTIVSAMSPTDEAPLNLSPPPHDATCRVAEGTQLADAIGQ